ncbi:MAG: PQQ-binding-like beta-propeller repeat protein [Alphaproteobacteria bacterium]|nr:PQQ-binding-like beta-propeller repeat protein [Alphaproteobacteria bacterium]
MTPTRKLALRLSLGLTLAGVLSACDTTGDLFSAPKGDRIQGDRIAILSESNRLAVDTSTEAEQIVLPQPVRNASWSQPGGNPDNVLHHLEASGPLNEIWERSIGEGSSSDARLVASPIVAEGVIFTLDAAAQVRALDAETGAVRWELDLTPEDEDSEVGFGGGLADEDGRLFVSTGFGFIVALDAKTGSELWRHQAPVPFRAAPAVNGGRVFIITQENQLLVLAADDGRLLWDHRGIAESAGVLASPSVAIAGDLVVVPYTSGELFGLRVPNGRQVWTDSLSRASRLNSLSGLSDIAGRPVIDRGLVIAVSHAGSLVAIDVRSGQRVWTRDIGGIQTPWVAGDYVYVVSSEAILFCIARKDGRIRFATQLARFEDEEDKEGPINWSGPVLASDRLLLASSNGEMISVSPYTGDILGRIGIPDGVYIAPIVANETVYVLTDAAELIALR